jgi:hypothetical protein
MSTKNDRIFCRFAGIVLVAALLAPSGAMAYVGPGSGLSAIGSVFAVIAAMFFAIVGFIWYPIKRVLRLAFKKRNDRSNK